jgi:hypothetical protein
MFYPGFNWNMPSHTVENDKWPTSRDYADHAVAITAAY